MARPETRVCEESMRGSEKLWTRMQVRAIASLLPASLPLPSLSARYRASGDRLHPLSPRWEVGTATILSS